MKACAVVKSPRHSASWIAYSATILCQPCIDGPRDGLKSIDARQAAARIFIACRFTGSVGNVLKKSGPSSRYRNRSIMASVLSSQSLKALITVALSFSFAIPSKVIRTSAADALSSHEMLCRRAQYSAMLSRDDSSNWPSAFSSSSHLAFPMVIGSTIPPTRDWCGPSRYVFLPRTTSLSRSTLNHQKPRQPGKGARYSSRRSRRGVLDKFDYYFP